MQRAIAVLKWMFYELPAVDGILLAALAFAFLFVKELDEQLQGRRKIRWTIFVVIVLFAIGGLVSDAWQKAEEAESKRLLQGQIGTLINSAQLQATHDDITMLDTHLIDGFARLEAAIKGTKPPKPAVQPTKHEPELPPALVNHLTITQRRAPSSNPQLPYSVQVIVQTDMSMPAAFAFVCTGDVGDMQFFIAGQSTYVDVSTGMLNDDKKIPFLKVGIPTMTPENPLVVTLFSRTNIRVTEVRQVH